MKNTNLTAKEAKMFSYTGSKMKYKHHFDTAHEKAEIKHVHTYIEAFAGTLSSMFHNLAKVAFIDFNRPVTPSLETDNHKAGVVDTNFTFKG